MKSKRYKIGLEIIGDFDLKHAKTLLSYQTYLLYDIRIELKSQKAYKAINYFLEKAKGNISDKFFRVIYADVDISWLEEYNKFCKLYFQSCFETNYIKMKLNQNVTEYNASIQNTIDSHDVVLFMKGSTKSCPARATRIPATSRQAQKPSSFTWIICIGCSTSAAGWRAKS